MLTDLQRQCGDSYACMTANGYCHGSRSPIIQLATRIRLGEPYRDHDYGHSVFLRTR